MRNRLRFVFRLCVILASCVVMTVSAHANIATSDYLNKYIKQRWGIDIPVMSNGNVFDMTYLMRTIDTANELLNGFRLIDYAAGRVVSYANDSKYATKNITSVGATEMYVDTLIQKIEFPFWVIPETSGTTFTINIAAGGTFYFDWGDGTVSKWDKNVGQTNISHTYSDSASNHTVRIGGNVTGYPTSDNGAIWFGGNAASDVARHVQKVGGCIGCLFHTLANGSQPKFRETFQHNKMLKEVPDDLFAGVTGTNARGMFVRTFASSGLKKLPKRLLGADAVLAPAADIFYETFYDCGDLTDTIPAGLFSGLSGAPAEYMFYRTFRSGGGLSGTIPGTLFDGIKGNPAKGMFDSTFQYCTNLTGISYGLFAGITGKPAPYMFSSAFYQSGINTIPSDLFVGISGETAEYMFSFTFYDTHLVSIPDNMFGDIVGDVKTGMFMSTFYNNTSLTGPSATVGTGDNKEFLYERWETPGGDAAYAKDNGLTDWDCIPNAWGGTGNKASGTCLNIDGDD